MPLFSVEGKRQKEIGVGEHWSLFRDFMDSELHHLLVDEIHKSLGSNKTVNSKHLGGKILNEVDKDRDGLLQDVDPSLSGSLFGMTLWNVVAGHPDEWRFYSEGKTSEDDAGGVIYFRKDE